MPVTTCKAARLFSTLRKSKTYLRNTISQNKFNGFVPFNIHRQISATPEEVLNEIAKTKKEIRLC